MDLDDEFKLDLEVAVKDALFEGVTNDFVLASLLTLAMTEIRTGRPLFESPLEEPILYSKYFRPWVRRTITTLNKTDQKEKDNDNVW